MLVRITFPSESLVSTSYKLVKAGNTILYSFNGGTETGATITSTDVANNYMTVRVPLPDPWTTGSVDARLQ